MVAVSFVARAPDFRSRGRWLELLFSHAWAICFTPLCLCLSEDAVTAVGASSQVDVSEKVKYPTLGKYVTKYNKLSESIPS